MIFFFSFSFNEKYSILFISKIVDFSFPSNLILSILFIMKTKLSLFSSFILFFISLVILLSSFLFVFSKQNISFFDIFKYIFLFVLSKENNSFFDIFKSIFFFGLNEFILKLLIVEDIFNLLDLNLRLLIFDFKHILITPLIDFSFKNFFFLGFGGGLGVFLIEILTILLHNITFLNLFIFFIGFLLLAPLFLFI